MKRRLCMVRGVLSLLACMTGTLAGAQEAASVAGAPVEAPAEQSAATATTTVILATSLGEIHLALETARAPITAGNFLRYVDAKRFDGIDIYRAYKVTEDGKYGIVQGGLQGDTKRMFKAIAHESPQVTGLSHVDGAVSMAREAPGTATADFFFVIGDLVSMDGKPDGSDPGYAVFANVTQGMDIVRSMLDLPRSAEARNPVMKGQMLGPPVKIITARRAP